MRMENSKCSQDFLCVICCSEFLVTFEAFDFGLACDNSAVDRVFLRRVKKICADDKEYRKSILFSEFHEHFV